jgi:YfiH family protein
VTARSNLERVDTPETAPVWYRFRRSNRLLGSDERFRHAMLTRLGGVSRGAFEALNLGSTVGDNPGAVAENHRRIFRALGIDPSRVVSPYQVHGCNVTRVDGSHGGRVIPETDALITDEPDLILLLRFADCVPVLLYDPAHDAVGLAHAGWRGTAAGVIPATVRAMTEAFGTRSGALWAGIGPAIGADHYEVGAEVVEAVRATLSDSADVAQKRGVRWHLDLPGAVAAQLKAAGVGHIARSGLCTACRTDEWYSHRAEDGKTGRFGVMVWITKA